MVFQEYQDPKLNKYLKLGYWYAERKEKINMIFVSILLVLLGALWFNVIYSVYIFIGSTPSYLEMEREMVENLSDSEALRKAMSPQDILVSRVLAVSGELPKTADFMAVLENLNNNWYLEFDYHFEWDGANTFPFSSFLLPGEKRPLIVKSVTVNGVPINPDFRITNVKWERMRDKEEIKRILEIKSGINFSQSEISVLSDSTTAKFAVLNLTIYDLRDIDFLTVLYRVGDPVAFGINSADILKSGEKRFFEQRWLSLFGGGLSSETYPVLNLKDKSSYRIPGGSQIFGR